MKTFVMLRMLCTTWMGIGCTAGSLRSSMLRETERVSELHQFYTFRRNLSTDLGHVLIYIC